MKSFHGQRKNGGGKSPGRFERTELATSAIVRSEERRVGKEGRSRRPPDCSSRRRHTRWNCDWSSDVCSSDLVLGLHYPSDSAAGKLLAEKSFEILMQCKTVKDEIIPRAKEEWWR